MTTRPHSLFLVLTIAGWMAVGLIVMNHNIAPLGSVTLNWPHPTHPTAHFHWSTQPLVVTNRGVVLLPARAKLTFSVRLPRGFTSGQVTVIPDRDMIGFYILRAETSIGQPVQEVKNYDRTELLDRTKLNFDWRNLVARGHEFSFSIISTGDTETKIRRIEVTAHR